MNKTFLACASLLVVAGVVSCNDELANENKTVDASTQAGTNSPSATSNNTTSNNNTSAYAGTNAKLPLTPADSTFVMKAATGGIMEVEAGKIAQQNGQSPRVKSFGAMMVRDHDAGNRDLISLAARHGLTVPTEMPADIQKHVEQMKKMKGKAFDTHYMSMMVNDHQRTIADFEKQANSGGNADLKTWAQKMLPTLQMHRDSATAISQSVK